MVKRLYWAFIVFGASWGILFVPKARAAGSAAQFPPRFPPKSIWPANPKLKQRPQS